MVIYSLIQFVILSQVYSEFCLDSLIIHVHASIPMYSCTDVLYSYLRYIFTHANMCINTCICIHTHTYTHVCIHHIHTCLHVVHMYLFTCPCVHVYVCTCTCLPFWVRMSQLSRWVRSLPALASPTCPASSRRGSRRPGQLLPGALGQVHNICCFWLQIPVFNWFL